jgi:hypothetical protein
MMAERKSTLPDGVLAVVYDKNPMEAKGYAAALADVAKEQVWVAEFYEVYPHIIVSSPH